MNYNYNMSKRYMNKLEAKIKELEEENKVLKELNVCVGCEDNPTYKARIDKAIEYIEKDMKRILIPFDEFVIWDDTNVENEINKLLDILKGSDSNDNS